MFLVFWKNKFPLNSPPTSEFPHLFISSFSSFSSFPRFIFICLIPFFYSFSLFFQFNLSFFLSFFLFSFPKNFFFLSKCFFFSLLLFLFLITFIFIWLIRSFSTYFVNNIFSYFPHQISVYLISSIHLFSIFIISVYIPNFMILPFYPSLHSTFMTKIVAVFFLFYFDLLNFFSISTLPSTLLTFLLKWILQALIVIFYEK